MIAVNRFGDCADSFGGDGAESKMTTKSTSGGIVMRAGYMLKSWGPSQRSSTLSAGEAELAAAVKTCT